MTRQHAADLRYAAILIREGLSDYAEAVLATCPQEPARAALAALKAGDTAEAARHVAEALAGLTEAQTGREG